MNQLKIQEIVSALNKIESEFDINILYACESGSRAWGFASPDSDYDVRFIYSHKKDWYLSLTEGTDTIDKTLEGDLDIGGWDIRKALKLIFKSNPTLWEWLQSPIIYKDEKGFKENIWRTSEPYYSLKSAFYHYISLAKRVYEETKENRTLIRSKKYFYILRPLLAACWTVDHESIPPMVFHKLCENSLLNLDLLKEIECLLKRKKQVNEKFEIERNFIIDDFIEKTLIECMSKAEKFQTKKNDQENLNIYLRGLLQ